MKNANSAGFVRSKQSEAMMGRGIKAEIERLNKEHEEKIARLVARIEGRWRARGSEAYYYLDDYGNIMWDRETRSYPDDFRYSSGNYFRTEEEAVLYKKKQIARQTIIDDTKGFVPNWEDATEKKWVINCGRRFIWVEADYTLTRNRGEIYFATKEDLVASIKKHEEEWKLVLDIES